MYLWKALVDQGAHQYRWVCEDGDYEFGCVAAAMNAAYPHWRKGEKAYVRRICRMFVVVESLSSDARSEAAERSGYLAGVTPLKDPSGSYPMYDTEEDAQHRIDTMPIHEEVVTRVPGALFTYDIVDVEFQVGTQEVTAAFESRYKEEEEVALGEES